MNWIAEMIVDMRGDNCLKNHVKSDDYLYKSLKFPKKSVYGCATIIKLGGA